MMLVKLALLSRLQRQLPDPHSLILEEDRRSDGRGKLLIIHVDSMGVLCRIHCLVKKLGTTLADAHNPTLSRFAVE